MNTKLHALGDALGRPIRLYLTEGQRSDFKGAYVLLPDLPPTKMLLGDRGYDGNKVRKIIQSRMLHPASRQRRTAKSKSNTAKPPTRNATRWKTSSQNSKIGGASQCGTTDAPTLSDPQSTSPQPSYSGYES